MKLYSRHIRHYCKRYNMTVLINGQVEISVTEPGIHDKATITTDEAVELSRMSDKRFIKTVLDRLGK